MIEPERMQEKAKRSRGKRASGDSVPYSLRSLWLPDVLWKNLEELAIFFETNAEGGPNYGHASWRTLVRRVAEDAPNIMRSTTRETKTLEQIAHDAVRETKTNAEPTSSDKVSENNNEAELAAE